VFVWVENKEEKRKENTSFSLFGLERNWEGKLVGLNSFLSGSTNFFPTQIWHKTREKTLGCRRLKVKRLLCAPYVAKGAFGC
jgi:hypothetical protein